MRNSLSLYDSDLLSRVAVKLPQDCKMIAMKARSSYRSSPIQKVGHGFVVPPRARNDPRGKRAERGRGLNLCSA